ncbi:hypothetical protein OVS_02245 [Mycoplasma ovis str. Michigan]|uniref:Uncharacterized protein n=1 Tax=Mycoplasma ovis str. Michigan TaxID=1415773 RepID=A0ABM5P213_9MOLU|nr:hypothetical protein [Mycoplasma ovis]AHC40310.1 hypothetical protein OVS_02245 [Mycoplasma ovis str. Michigan]
MSISLKIWIPALTIGGAGGIIGLPIYFSQTQNSVISSVKPQHQMPSTSLTKVESVDSVPESKKSFAKGECAIISLPENLGQFLQGQHKNKGDYVSTSCKNTGVKNDYIPLPKDWTGLFPSLVLAGNLK